MKLEVASLVAGTLLTAATALAQQQYHYSCIWRSNVTPGAKIQFTSTNGIGGYQGALYMDGNGSSISERAASRVTEATGGRHPLKGRTSQVEAPSCCSRTESRSVARLLGTRKVLQPSF